MPDNESEGPIEDGSERAPREEHENEPRPPADNPTEDSIFGETSTVYTTPALNAGVPRDPAFMRVLSGVEIAVGIALFALVFVGVMYQVLGRYVPGLSWVGAGELALLSMVALTFVTTGYLVGRNGHVVIEVFDQLLEGRRLFAVLRIVSAIIMALTCAALAYEAFVKMTSEWDRTSAAMHIPVGLLYGFALLGFVSAAVHSIMKIPFAHRPERKLDISEMEG
jgi:TRAP-type C4-dicarboxylate transport system permease small subunit